MSESEPPYPGGSRPEPPSPEASVLTLQRFYAKSRSEHCKFCPLYCHNKPAETFVPKYCDSNHESD